MPRPYLLPLSHPAPPTPSRSSVASVRLVRKRDFFDDRWSANRTVTAMDWSPFVSHIQPSFILTLKPFPPLLIFPLSFLPPPQHSEVLLVSYNANSTVFNDPDGVALIWDMKFPKGTPDYIFNCQVTLLVMCSSRDHHGAPPSSLRVL